MCREISCAFLCKHTEYSHLEFCFQAVQDAMGNKKLVSNTEINKRLEAVKALIDERAAEARHQAWLMCEDQMPELPIPQLPPRPMPIRHPPSAIGTLTTALERGSGPITDSYDMLRRVSLPQSFPTSHPLPLAFVLLLCKGRM